MKAGQVLAVLLVLAGLVAGGIYLLQGEKEGDHDPSELPGKEGPEEPGELDAAKRLTGGEGERAGPPVRRNGVRKVPVRSSERGSASVRVRLLQDGKPLGGAEAWLQRAGERGGAKEDAVTSDAGGRATFEGIAVGRYQLAVDHAEVPLDWRGEVFGLGDGESKDLGDVAVPRAAGIRGRVVSDTGAVVAGATISLRAGLIGSILPSANLPEAKTDTSGAFTLTRVRPASWVVFCDHPDFLRLEKKVDLEPGLYGDVGTLTLARGRELRGVVVDSDGRGVAGAKVSYEHQSRFGGDTAEYYADKRAVKTGETGEFAMRGLPDRVKLRVVADGFEPLVDHSVKDDAVTVRLVLAQRRGVSGVVTNAGEHAVTVWLIGAPRARGGRPGLLPRRFSVQAAEGGRFHVPSVDPGTYTILAEAKEFGASKPRRIRVGAQGVSGVELTMLEGPVIEVVVTGTGGRPVSGARVRLRMREAVADLPGEESVDLGRAPQRVERSDEAGTATLRGAWRGRGVLDVAHPDYLPGVRDNLLIRDGKNRVEIKLEAGGFIAGTCTDTTGNPLSGIEVRAGPKSDGSTVRMRVRGSGPGSGPGDGERNLTGGSKFARSDKQGRFKLGPLRPGLYVVRARRGSGGMTLGQGDTQIRFADSGGSDAKTETQVVAAQTSEVALRLARPGSLSGAVRYNGQAIAGARVFARQLGDDDPMAAFGGKRTRTDENGRYEFGELAVGEWSVQCKPPNGPIATRSVTVRVAEGVPVTKDIELSGGQIIGRAQRAAGDLRGFAGIDVMLTDPAAPQQRRVAFRLATSNDGGTSTSGMTMRPPGAPDPVALGKDGSFKVNFVPAGKWLVRVREAGEVALWSKEVELVDNQLLDLGTIPLEAVFPVALKIVDPQGAPIAMGSVRVAKLDAQNEAGEVVFTGFARNGECKIKGLAAGRYQLSFRRISGRAGSNAPSQTGELVVDPQGRVTGSELRIR